MWEEEIQGFRAETRQNIITLLRVRYRTLIDPVSCIASFGWMIDDIERTESEDEGIGKWKGEREGRERKGGGRD